MKNLKVMDATAIAFCRDNEIPIVVFDMSSPGFAAAAILLGEHVGTIVRDALTEDGYAGRVTEEALLEAIEKMEKAVEHVQSLFATVRTGRAAPALVEKLNVDYYGSPVPLQQLAAIQVPEARQLLVRPHDRNSLGADRKGDPRQRPRRVALQRRRRDPTQLSPAHRGAPPRVCEGCETHGRGRPYRGPQRAPRRPQGLESAEKVGVISADELERAEKELEKITHEHVDRIEARWAARSTSFSRSERRVPASTKFVHDRERTGKGQPMTDDTWRAGS